MGRYRCPSQSSLSAGGGSLVNVNVAGNRANMPGPPNNIPEVPNHRRMQPARRIEKGKGRARIPAKAKVDAWKKEDLRMAMKKADIKSNKREWSFVFVGNLHSSVTEAQLEAMFERFGTIRCIKIRASSGVCVPTANLPKSYWGFGEPLESVHYATVEFSTPAAAKKALELTGQVLTGKRIVVSFSPVDLPETTDIIKCRLKNKEPYVDKRSAWKIRFGQLKRLTIEKTEYVPDPRKASPNGPGKVFAEMAERLGKLLPVPVAGSTAAEGHQYRHGHLPMPFPKTLL